MQQADGGGGTKGYLTPPASPPNNPAAPGPKTPATADWALPNIPLNPFPDPPLGPDG